ncbi:hypothetical protein BDR05DRAFT_1004491 [Suillus weaverae]|nr:hypothetical protein BDR05DRAFT_1004491 [Suillus weaverae]
MQDIVHAFLLKILFLKDEDQSLQNILLSSSQPCSAYLMDISPSGYPWNNGVKPSEYPWDDEVEDLQDIICRIEEDFPADSTNGVPSYIATPYNSPLFHLFNSPQLEVPNAPVLHSLALHSPAPHSPAPHPHSPAPHSPAPHSPVPHSPAPHSPVPHSPAPYSLVPPFPVLPFPAPPYQAPALSTPGPSAPAAAPIPAAVTSALAAPTPAPAATTSAVRPINFIMVMDGEKGKRVSKKTGVMKPKTIPKTPAALKDYDPLKPLANEKIVLIIQEVEQNIQEEAVRETRLTNQEDREKKVKDELKAAAQKHFPTDADGTSTVSAAAWTDRNLVALYMPLSKPLVDIMRKLKSIAESQYIQGYGLRPDARSPDTLNEKTYTKKKVKQLIPPAKPDNEFTPLAFTYDDQSNPLENPVIWNILLDSICGLGYNKYVGDAESLDCLFRAATAAVYCCLDQVPRGKKVQFSKADHSSIYDKVDLFMNQVIYADKVKTRNWIEFRRITHLKLTT